MGNFMPGSSRKPLRVKVDGQIVFNTINPMIEAALQGFGIALAPEATVLQLLRNGSLVQVLDDWCKPFDGFHLSYPNRRQQSPAFQIFVNALRHRS